MSRRRFLGRAGRVGLSLAGAMLLGASQPALAQPLLSPAALFGRLVTTPFEPAELPAGFRIGSSDRAPLAIPSASDDIPAVVGGCSIDLSGPDLTDRIWFYVFGTEADAFEHFEHGEFGRSTTSASEPPSTESRTTSPQVVPGPASTTITEVYAPAGFDGPAWCVAAKTKVWGWTSCAVLDRNVEIIGYSKANPGHGADRGDDANAIALARVGTAHLARIRAA